MFKIYAYEEGCKYSSVILSIFDREDVHAKIKTFKKGIERPPENTDLSTLPRIYFKNHLISDSTQFVKIYDYFLKNHKNWKQMDTENIMNMLLFPLPKKYYEDFMKEMYKLLPPTYKYNG